MLDLLEALLAETYLADCPALAIPTTPVAGARRATGRKTSHRVRDKAKLDPAGPLKVQAVMEDRKEVIADGRNE